MLAFVHIEKTAGMTLHGVLKRSFGTRHVTVQRVGRAECFSPADFRLLRRLYPHLESIGGHWVRPCCGLEKEVPGIRYWTFLREPLARCASMYQYQVQTMGVTEPFEEWIELPRRRNFQTRKLDPEGVFETARRVLDGFAIVGLSERFDASLLLLNQAAGGRLDLRYRRVNVAQDTSIAQGLLRGRHTRRLLELANQVDQQTYEYALNTIFPRQEADYPGSLHDPATRRGAGATPTGARIRHLASDAKRRLLYEPYVALMSRRSQRTDANSSS